MSELGKILQWVETFEDEKKREEYLKSKGFEIEAIDNKAIDIFDQISSKNILRRARHRKALFERASELIQERDSINVKELISSFKTKSSNQFAYQFSKLDNVSDEDVLNMLKDEELLKVIENLEK
ncbi:MAG: hypothetical protein JJ895_12140 [Balneolaceae bacterium]|nr:hypothetical protein [Balneolaceae bacterium]